MDTPDTSRADRTYEWVVRGLYAALITAELFYLWDHWKDSPQGLDFRRRLADRVQGLRKCEPCARRRAWIRDRAHMLWQADDIIGAVDANPDSMGGPPG